MCTASAAPTSKPDATTWASAPRRDSKRGSQRPATSGGPGTTGLRRGRGDRDALGAGPLDGAGDETGLLGVLDHAADVGEAGVAPPGHGDGLLHAHEAPLDEARPRELAHQAEQGLGEPGERLDLARLQELERGVGPLRRDETGPLEVPAEEQLVVRAGRGGDAHAVP